MGVQPEVFPLRIQRSLPRHAKQPPRGLSKRSSFRRHSHPEPIELPEDVLALKMKILETHPAKMTRFSLSHLRHVAIPPVLIPDTLNDRRAIRTVVSGKSVPLTRGMWCNCKRKTKHLDMIDEYVTYRTQKRPQEDPLATPLPQEAQQLKMQILKAHPEPLMRFSMSRMRHIVAQSPVEIPAELRRKNLVSSRVSGHSVPLTRSMWDNKKKQYKKRQLDIIGEGVHYQ
ncbi:hypothetical protein BBJ29_007943 [Phytophthora kernoviae]|uniref:Uncharacterized protein n=1 Tax=Phytophthora kernoviae TaxID=325452 RepID=A0A3F2RIC7_9STRA|nr:hypothetical protein BBJ29_007943 [Phytophthora kernoviae]RLN57725.1 hypothetical protein BBP00_00007385 [Phytophthora kernoviae]